MPNSPETLESVVSKLITRLRKRTAPASIPTGPLMRPAEMDQWAKDLSEGLGLRYEEIGEPKPGDPDFVEPTRGPTLRETLEAVAHEIDQQYDGTSNSIALPVRLMEQISAALKRDEAVEAKPIDDGGPMFPSHGSMGEVAHEGASRRDWLAGQAPPLPEALRALAYRFADVESPDKSHKDKSRVVLMVVAEWRYLYADAMIEAGKKGGAS